MHNLVIEIGGYIVKLETDSSTELVPGERFANNIRQSGAPDILIRVSRKQFLFPVNTEKVFHAPLFEDVDSAVVLKEENFWSVLRSGSDIFISTILPFSDTMKGAVLKFSAESSCWELYIESSGESVDPLSYPLDSLILYYLTAINGDIFVHASGVTDGKKGYIFSGVSGKGKSTMAKIWNENGWKVIHDDRLVIRKREGGVHMFNTPVYNNDTPATSIVSAVYLIEHGNENHAVGLKGAEAVAHFMTNCIQHNWNPHFTENLLTSVSELCSSLPVSRLRFIPGRMVIDYILKNDHSHDK